MLYHLFVTIPLYHPHPLLVIFAYCLHLTSDLLVLKTGLDSLTNILPRCSLWLGKKHWPSHNHEHTHTQLWSETLSLVNPCIFVSYLAPEKVLKQLPFGESIVIHQASLALSSRRKLPGRCTWICIAGKMTFFLCKQSTGTSKSCWVPKAIHTDWTNNSFTGRHVVVVQDVPGIFIVLIILLEVTIAFLGTGFWHQATLTKPTMLLITIILHNCP